MNAAESYTWPDEWFLLDATGEIVNVVSNTTRERAEEIAAGAAVQVSVAGSVPMSTLRRYEQRRIE